MAAREAPEGIVLYSRLGLIKNLKSGVRNYEYNLVSNTSWPGNRILLPNPVYNTLEDALKNDGIVDRSERGQSFIDFSDSLGTLYLGDPDTVGSTGGEKLVLSKSKIGTLDFLSEGPIEGISSGIYINAGRVGMTGWDTSVFSGHKVISGQSWLRSVYWNEVPILSDNGQFNFQSINTSYTPGVPNGEILEQLIWQQTTSKSISERLRAGDENIKYYRILNRDCRSIILNVKIPSLYKTNPATGDIGRDGVQYNVSYRPIFSSIGKKTSFSEEISERVWGKIASSAGYIRSTFINLKADEYISEQTSQTVYVDNFLDDDDFIGWELKVSRITEDSTTSFSSNASYVDSITELYGNQLTYPNSAMVYSLYDAEFFNSVPDRAFECDLLKVLIPANYDPITRNYNQYYDESQTPINNGRGSDSGYWNGDFAEKKAWTNNPAWCFYDLLTNKRYGLGKYIDTLNIDKFTLYRIGQYCDELVSDGEGGLEPRFTCNTWISSREDAYKVINDMASVFRALTYYANGTVYAIQDSPKTSRVIFTNSNVENGDFNYSSTSKRARQSVAIVRYNNPKDFYRPALEYVEDLNSVRKYGVRELDLTAFACTSKNQAIRFGRWALLSNNIENETVQFVGGIESSLLNPGDIFTIVDYNRKLKRHGGRVFGIEDLTTGAYVTLDSVVPLETGITYDLSVLTPSYFYNSSQTPKITDVDYNDIRRSFLQKISFSGGQASAADGKTKIGLYAGFNQSDYSIEGHPIWSIELGTGFINYTGSRFFSNSDNDSYRVISIKENDIHKYEVVGLKYWPGKFNIVDSGLNYERN